MRIGIDMLGGQDPDGQGRGVGRYVGQFVESLTCLDTTNEYLLYSFDRLPAWPGHAGTRTQTRILQSGHGPLAKTVQTLVDHNPDRLDLFLVTSPFSKVEGYRPPTKPVGRLRLASILYDLIPLLVDRNFYVGAEPADLADYFERLARLRDYDLILAISNATRADALSYLGLLPRRVVNISAATRDGFFTATEDTALPVGLKELGISQPYVLSVASADPHKNTHGLVRAFALLQPAVRASHQLVIAGAAAEDYVLKWRLTALAKQHGILDRLVLVGRLSDEQLRQAYQHCAAFAFVSHYEGFGLPILEAMLCAAPVVAGDNSSQIELTAGAGLLAQTRNDADVADKLGRILTDPGLAASLRQRGLERARAFSWQETVKRTQAAFGVLPVARGLRPLLAWFVPPTSRRPAAADHVRVLLEGLRRRYAIHLYHDAGQIPDVALAEGDYAAFDWRLFERHDRVWNYHAVFYNLGDGPCDEAVRHSLSQPRYEWMPMTTPSPTPVLSRCWRILTSLFPQRLRARLREPWKAVLKRLSARRASARRDELSLQLDAILRELRRLHARLEELHEGLDGRTLTLAPPATLPAQPERHNEHEAA
jgi:glycosyltransferase involved in cell wall biosynthesis